MRNFNRIGPPWRVLLIAAILSSAGAFILTPEKAEAIVAVRGPYGRTAVVAGHRGYYGGGAYYRGGAGYYRGGVGYYGGARGVARRTSRRVYRRNAYYYNNY